MVLLAATLATAVLLMAAAPAVASEEKTDATPAVADRSPSSEIADSNRGKTADQSPGPNEVVALDQSNSNQSTASHGLNDTSDVPRAEEILELPLVLLRLVLL